MSEFHFRRIPKIVLAWVPQQAGPETRALLGGLTAGECDPWSRSETQGKEAGGGAGGAATPSHRDGLSGRGTCVSELPAEGMSGKHSPTSSRPSMATGDLAGIRCCPFLGWAASGGALDDGVRKYVLAKRKDRGAWRILHNRCGCARAKAVRVCLEPVTAGAAGTKGEGQRTLRSIRGGGLSGPQTSVLSSADRCLQCGRQRQLRASATSRWRFWLIAWPRFLIVEFSRKFHLQDQSHRRSSMCFYMWKEPNQNPASGNPWLPQVSHYLNAAVCIKSVPLKGPECVEVEGGRSIAC